MSHFLTMIIWGKTGRELDSCFIGENTQTLGNLLRFTDQNLTSTHCVRSTAKGGSSPSPDSLSKFSLCSPPTWHTQSSSTLSPDPVFPTAGSLHSAGGGGRGFSKFPPCASALTGRASAHPLVPVPPRRLFLARALTVRPLKDASVPSLQG